MQSPTSAGVRRCASDNPDGGIAGEFSMLVRVARRVPAEITRLTGITQDAIDREVGHRLMR